jgi:endonuclease YncB( thermonuclease family)
MCWWYRKYAGEQSDVDRVLYEDAERRAREGRVGLWRDPAPVAPWEWRRRGIYKEWGRWTSGD